MHLKRRGKEDDDEAGCFAPRVAATMFGCVGCFWVLLSSALVAVCTFGFISPAWIVTEQLRTDNLHHGHRHKKESVSFGLLWHCSESPDHTYRCYRTFGGLGKFAEIASTSWQTSAALCSGGCALLAVGSLLAVVGVFLPGGGCERRFCALAGYTQMAADSILRVLAQIHRSERAASREDQLTTKGEEEEEEAAA
ncbi:LHFPL tetraspan subfamily member 6 protein isoform X3 [Syngnathoides biaculeatus]|uniref:LHFPL tetraspan subfamily member 6 protein isoform X3 n=1 Tax=Syngnathoides biaculeatus TaxID=300417 RepID=UPI002ADD9596|nr:LHFPL tetraspan subfamily member 6 protein isoform X3 [Syngnathoides biaculeatus]